MEPTLVVVDLGNLDLATTEAEAGVAFPVVVEAVDSVEFDGVVRVDEQFEHAASADGGELERVADEDDAPLLLVGKRCEFGELRCRHHPGLVDDDGRPGGQVVLVIRWPVEAMLDEQLVERVGGDAGLVLQYLGCGGRRCDAEDRSTLRSELRDGWPECGGLAGAGWSDDQHELRVASDSGGGFGLGDVQVDIAAVDRCWIDQVVGRDPARCPFEECQLLVEDRLGGEGSIGGGLGDGPAVSAEERVGWDRLGDVDALLLRDRVHDLVECADHGGGVTSDVGREQTAKLAVQLGRSPGRLLLADRLDRSGHQQRGLVGGHRQARVAVA